jgi:hypothetical protein
MPGAIGPPTPTNSGHDQRPVRVIRKPDGSGEFHTKLTDAELAVIDHEWIERRQRDAEQLKALFKARLGDPEGEAAARLTREQARPGLSRRLAEVIQTHAELQVQTAQRRGSAARAQDHLAHMQRELLDAEQRCREHEQQRVAAVTAALSGGHEVAAPAGATVADDIALLRGHVVDAELALAAIEGELVRAETAEQQALGVVYSAAEAILADQAEELVCELAEHEALAAMIRASLWQLGTLLVPSPGRTHQFKVPPRVVAAVNGSGAVRTGSPSIDWTSRLWALIAGEG